MIYKQHIMTMLKAGQVPMLEGAPGGGKTAVAQQIARQLGWDFLAVVMSVMDLMDPNGLPAVIGGKARFLPFGIFEKIYKAKKDVLVVADDLGQAMPGMQAALMQLIWGGKLNEHTVSPKVHWMICTNRPKDKAGVMQIITPIRNRVRPLPWVMECTCSGDTICSWHLWAIEHDIHPAVRAYVTFRPQCLAEYDEANVDLNAQVCSARGMEGLSDCEHEGIEDPKMVLIESCIGKKYGSEYLGFRTMWNTLPMIDEIIRDPKGAIVPPASKPDQIIAVSTMLSHDITPKNASRAMEYIARLPLDVAMACVTAAEKRVPELVENKAYVQWMTKNAPKFRAA